MQHLLQFIGITLLQSLIGKHQHGVTREDSRVGIPLAMHGGFATSHVGIVHQVIVQQCIVMIGLQCTGGHQYVFRIVLIHIVCQQHQHGTDTLAAKRKHILDRLVDRFRFSLVGQATDKIIHHVQ